MRYRGFRVGVFYKSNMWVKKWFNDFLSTIDTTCISRYSINDLEIILKDGTRIKAYGLNHCLRGVLIDKAFVEPGVDDETANIIIKPLLRHATDIIVETDGYSEE